MLGNGRAVVFAVDGPTTETVADTTMTEAGAFRGSAAGSQLSACLVEDLQQGEQLTNRLREELTHLWPR
ncbi:hypothetical protein [Streptomyces rubiginosohelvolus]